MRIKLIKLLLVVILSTLCLCGCGECSGGACADETSDNSTITDPDIDNGTDPGTSPGGGTNPNPDPGIDPGTDPEPDPEPVPGSCELPFEIHSATDFANIKHQTNACYTLMNDLFLTNSESINFSGILEGNGKTITLTSLPYFSHSAALNYGLFGHITGSIKDLQVHYTGPALVMTGNVGYIGIFAESLGLEAVVDNVTVVGDLDITAFDITGGTGGLAGENAGTLMNSSYTGNITVKSSNILASPTISAAGIVSRNSGTIEKNSSAGSIDIKDFNSNAGGIAAYNTGSIRMSSSSMDVRIDNSFVGDTAITAAGGLAARNSHIISNSYSTGNILSISNFTTYVGGISGYNTNSITYSYAYGTIKAESIVNTYAGGIVGYSFSGSIDKTVALATDITSTGGLQTHLGRIGGYKGSSSFTNNLANSTLPSGTTNAEDGSATAPADLILEQTYIDLGWNMTEIWKLESMYPVLR